MKQLLTITRLYLKAIMVSPPYQAGCCVLTILTILLSLTISLTPEVNHTNIGYCTTQNSQISNYIIENLNQLAGYKPILYTDIDKLRQDVTAGRLSAGFYLNPDMQQQSATSLTGAIIAVFYAESPATPFVKETIASVYLKALSYDTAISYLEKSGNSTAENRGYIIDHMTSTYHSDALMKIEILKGAIAAPATAKISSMVIIISAITSAMIILPGVLAPWWNNHLRAIKKPRLKIGFYLSLFISFFLLASTISLFVVRAEPDNIALANLFLSGVATILFFLMTHLGNAASFAISIALAGVSFLCAQSVISFATYGLPEYLSAASPAWFYLKLLGL